ncbi:MAG TPA: TIGR03960 family B12-binding radical SAM protein [Polyangiaceae bacterium]|nr:TIGR03960 family B12-binding radical SAM protein [Polyangiaceae bacterium]
MSRLFDHPYAAFLHRVAKPSRYTCGEHGVRRKDWRAVEARVCLAFPDIYDIGMSHLGYRMLYRILNDEPRLLAERCYTPWVDMQRELYRHGKLLCSLESARPLCDFDVVGFSLQYELTFTNILTMLDLGGIPLRSEHRSDDDPLIIAGGPVATHAEPLAIFLDAILIGDGEEAATEIALCWADTKRRGLPRHERLIELSRIPGVYVPSLYETAVDPESQLEVVTRAKHPDAPLPVVRRLLADINRFPFPDDGPVGGPEAIFDRMSIEVARGCTEGCRFCQAGMIYRPVRERDPKQVIETVLRALEKSGQDEVSLTALSTADVSCISPLIKELVEKTAPERVSLGVASLRAYGLAEDLLDDLRKVRASGLTFAPEAGTQRMRDVINKNVTEEQLLETAERVFSRGFDKMKLYFILGLPTEEDEDVLGIIEVGKNALGVGKRLGKRPKVTVSVSTHVPKPHTPFQWCAMDPLEEVSRKQRLLREAVRAHRGLTLRLHDASTSVLECVLARGDRRLGPVIERAYLHGARFDSWEDQVDLRIWQEAFEHFQLDTSALLGTLPIGARLPWDHFDIGLEDGFLAREYRKALRGRLSPPCGKAAGAFIHHTNVADAVADRRRLVCYDCGVACDMGRMRERRIGFLTKMGAHAQPGRGLEAAQPRPIPDPAPPRPGPHPAPAPDPNPVPNPNPHPRPNPNPTRQLGQPERLRPPQQGTLGRYRLQFTKTGPAALLGHLDLLRELPRAIRRAGVKTAYTAGYHPKPDMSFGPALGLGVVSLAEYVDVKLLGAGSADGLLERLAATSSGGLTFMGAVQLEAGDPSVSRVITGARYVLALAESVVADLGGRPALEERIASFLAQSSARVRRDVKGIGKMVDVRAFVETLAIGGADAAALLARAGLIGRNVPIELTVAVRQDGGVRLNEVAQALLGAADVPFVAVRTQLLAGAGSPLDLERFRSPLARRSSPPPDVISSV